MPCTVQALKKGIADKDVTKLQKKRCVKCPSIMYKSRNATDVVNHLIMQITVGLKKTPAIKSFKHKAKQMQASKCENSN